MGEGLRHSLDSLFFLLAWALVAASFLFWCPLEYEPPGWRIPWWMMPWLPALALLLVVFKCAPARPPARPPARQPPLRARSACGAGSCRVERLRAACAAQHLRSARSALPDLTRFPLAPRAALQPGSAAQQRILEDWGLLWGCDRLLPLLFPAHELREALARRPLVQR
jgi:hypothetical protein